MDRILSPAAGAKRIEQKERYQIKARRKRERTQKKGNEIYQKRKRKHLTLRRAHEITNRRKKQTRKLGKHTNDDQRKQTERQDSRKNKGIKKTRRNAPNPSSRRATAIPLRRRNATSRPPGPARLTSRDFCSSPPPPNRLFFDCRQIIMIVIITSTLVSENRLDKLWLLIIPFPVSLDYHLFDGQDDDDNKE